MKRYMVILLVAIFCVPLLYVPARALENPYEGQDLYVGVDYGWNASSVPYGYSGEVNVGTGGSLFADVDSGTQQVDLTDIGYKLDMILECMFLALGGVVVYVIIRMVWPLVSYW